MNCEIVECPEKSIVGVSAQTSNDDPHMGEMIGNLWKKLYQQGISESIENKVNAYAIGLYSDYQDNHYQVTAGHEVSLAQNSELTVKLIPAGKYAKFSLHGPLQEIVANAWKQIWQMDLDRSYTGDYEEYLNADFENADVDIYIALK